MRICTCGSLTAPHPGNRRFKARERPDSAGRMLVEIVPTWSIVMGEAEGYEGMGWGYKGQTTFVLLQMDRCTLSDGLLC